MAHSDRLINQGDSPYSTEFDTLTPVNGTVPRKKKGLIIPIYVNHAGCPHRCTFCDQDRIAGVSNGIPGEGAVASLIMDYLESWKGKGRREVAFYGGSFTAIGREVQKRLLESVRPFIRRGEIDAVRLSTRPDAVDEEALRFLKNYGVETVELGIQSLDDQVLSAAGRRYTGEEALYACRLLKEAGLKLGCQVMPGLPFDASERSLDGVRQLSVMRPDFARIYPALVLKGTELEELYRRGDYTPMPLDEAVSLSADMAEVFEASGTEVIRTGLQPTAELEASVVAGPWHPAFGALVESERFLRRAVALIEEGTPLSDGVTFTVSPRDESAFRGMRNGNMKKLQVLYPSLRLNLARETALPRGSLAVCP